VPIVRLALEGRTTTRICRITRHSPQAVSNYLSTFERCVQLARRGMQAGQIARETYHSVESVDRYLGQYDRVRHCRLEGLSPGEPAHALGCGVWLVLE